MNRIERTIPRANINALVDELDSRLVLEQPKKTHAVIGLGMPRRQPLLRQSCHRPLVQRPGLPHVPVKS